MQALGPSTVFPCYAAEDRETAAQTTDFLQKGADVRVFFQEGEMAAGGDLAAKAREGRMADIVLVFFSRKSLPSRWPRSQWEDALVKEPAAEGIRIAFLKCDDCIPPKILENQFDLSGRRLDGLRGLKRWVRGGSGAYTAPGADVELIAMAVADRPGMEMVDSIAVANAAAQACAEDFDAVIRLHCPGRTLTALAGDLGWQLGLKLERELESNLEKLESFCAERRLLVLLEAPDEEAAEALIFGGRCSTIISSEPGRPSSDPLHEAQRALLAGAGNWNELCQMARIGRQITTPAGRTAERFELMQQWRALAEERGDGEIMNEASREMVWILEGWGRSSEAGRLEFERARTFDEQLPLF